MPGPGDEPDGGGAVEAGEAGEAVGGDGGVGVADVRDVVHVVDRRRDVQRTLGQTEGQRDGGCERPWWVGGEERGPEDPYQPWIRQTMVPRDREKQRIL